MAASDDLLTYPIGATVEPTADDELTVVGGVADQVLVHLDELARQAPAFLRHRDQPDQQHHQLLVVRARLDRRSSPIGNKISAREFRQLNIEPAAFHGDWNYVVKPRPQPD